MATEDFKRRLTAILSADVEGYSRLMREDEEATVRTITAYRAAMAKLIQQYRGRVVDSPGDNILAEFTSVVDAVNCAVEIQRELAERNAELPVERKMEFRIGVNLGDVIEEGERIYGDGVNIAARVEGLAEGGGICISGTVYDAIEAKLGLEYEYLGEQAVKNIPKPVRVYRVLSFPGAAAHRVIKAKKAVGRKWLNMALAITAILVVVVAAVAIWNFYLRAPRVVPASVERMAFPLPDKPSIAVLPFTNISGEPEQEYFVDGLTEQIITNLSKIPRLFVIARNSTFTYKGKPVKVKQVSEELGVRYVLEGSAQKSGDRVRITVQLVDAISGHHLWAEKYDRYLRDIFALQDEITMKIMTGVQVKLTAGEHVRLLTKGTDNLEAYLKVLQGREYRRRYNREDNVRARQMFEEAIALDPEYPMPYVSLGWTHILDWRHGWTKSPQKSMDRAVELAQKALTLDETYAFAHSFLAYVYRNQRQYEKAIAEGERAIALDPNYADAYAILTGVLCYAGRPEEAFASVKKAIRLDPFPPTFYFYYFGLTCWMTGRYEEAIANYKKALYRRPTYELAHIGLTATYSSAGHKEDARAQAAELLRVNPEFSLEYLAKTIPFKTQADTERFISALREAGLK
jgi:adenylate cyclase